MVMYYNIAVVIKTIPVPYGMGISCMKEDKNL